MVDAEAALAAAQKLADQYTSQAAGAQGSFQGSENAENGDLGGQKRKFEDDAEDEAAIRKRTSFNDPHDGGQVCLSDLPTCNTANSSLVQT